MGTMGEDEDTPAPLVRQAVEAAWLGDATAIRIKQQRRHHRGGKWRLAPLAAVGARNLLQVNGFLYRLSTKRAR